MSQEAQSHHRAAEANVKELLAAMGRAQATRMSIPHAQAVYTEQMVLAGMATAQALLAINETLHRIANRQDTP